MSSENQGRKTNLYTAIIQARATSTRFPGKVFQLVNGKSLVTRVFEAAKGSWADKVIVAWPERYPDLDENNVLERFRRISNEFPSRYIIRLTSDCPLLTSEIINDSINRFHAIGKGVYYCNRDKYPDGFDVQIFTPHMLHGNYATHKEHVIAPSGYPDVHYLSVDTPQDLKNVREYVKKYER